MRPLPTVALSTAAAAVMTGVAATPAISREPLADQVVVTRDDGWDLLREEPGQEQRDAGYVEKMWASAQQPELLTFRFRILDFPASAPGADGIHSTYSVDFVTVTRRGTDPIQGSAYWSTYAGEYYSSASVAEEEVPCAGALTRYNSETSVAVLGIDKDCFPGASRRVSRVLAEVRTYNVEGGRGTDDVVENQVRNRQLTPVGIR